MGRRCRSRSGSGGIAQLQVEVESEVWERLGGPEALGWWCDIPTTTVRMASFRRCWYNGGDVGAIRRWLVGFSSLGSSIRSDDCR